MADSTQDGTQASQAEGSESSGNQTGVQPTASVTVEQFNQLQSQLETLRRSLQSDKDKAVKKTNARVDALEGDLRSVLQGAVKDGKSLTDVLSEIDAEEERQARQSILEMARIFREGKLPEVGSGGSGQAAGVKAADVVQELGLPVEDVRVKAFMSLNFADGAEAYREAAKLTKSLSRQPSDADRAGEVAEQQKNASTQEQLMQEYKTGSKNLLGNELVRYKQEMRKRGLNIT